MVRLSDDGLDAGLQRSRREARPSFPKLGRAARTADEKMGEKLPCDYEVRLNATLICCSKNYAFSSLLYLGDEGKVSG
jgi:hypothetical protein